MLCWRMGVDEETYEKNKLRPLREIINETVYARFNL